MQSLIRLVLIIAILCFPLLGVFGCAPNETFVLPQLKPDTLYEIKYLTLTPSRGIILNSGVYLERGDFYSIVVTGKVVNDPFGGRALSNDFFDPLSRLRVSIDKNPQKIAPINATLAAQNSGEIRVSFYYKRPLSDLRGSLNIAIILWNTKNLDQISNYFRNVESAFSDEENLQGISDQAIRLKTYVSQKQQGLEPLIVEDAAIGKDNLGSQVSGIEVAPKDAHLDHEGTKNKSFIQNNANPEAAGSDKDRYPPVMLIITPKDGLTVSSVAIQLIGVVEDDNGIKKIEIFINGKLIALDQGRGIHVDTAVITKRYEINESIAVSSGSNQIKIVAEDVFGRITEANMIVNRKNKRGKVWAVIVGVNTYTELPHLKYAVKDAYAFRDHLLDNNLSSPENIFLLTDEQATIGNLRTVLGTEIKRKAGKEDLVIIYFAGHGSTEKDSRSPDGDGLEKYLLPYDANPENLYATALPMREIAHILDRINSDRLVFIADACYSGASGGRTIARQGYRANLSDDFLNRISSGKGRVIISASGPNEVSAEDDRLEHGVFTYYLIKALKGKADYDSDGLITVDEAYRYVSKEVPKATGQEQHPVKKGTVEGQLVLSIINK